MSACVPCVPLPVRVDISAQTDDGSVDRVPVHMVPREVSQSFVRTPWKWFFGTAVCVHKGKDGRVVSSRVGQERGCGEEGKQDLKTANMCGAIVDIPLPFRADPHALGKTLFEGGRMIWA
jgi:hypothetical protein